MKTITTSQSVSLSACFLAAVWVFTSLSATAQSGQIVHFPEAVEITAGETFEVAVQVDPMQGPVSVVDLHMVFDPAFLEVISVAPLFSSLSANVVAPTFNNTLGTIDMAAFQLGEALPTGSFDLLQITFKALNEVSSTSVEHPLSIFPKTVMAYAGENRLGYVGPLQVTIHASEGLSTLETNVDGIALDLWPNPTSDHTFVSFTSDYLTAATLEIYDLHGKVVQQVYRGTAAPGVALQFEVNVAQLAGGMYMCRLVTDSGSLVKRLMVTK